MTRKRSWHTFPIPYIKLKSRTAKATPENPTLPRWQSLWDGTLGLLWETNKQLNSSKKERIREILTLQSQCWLTNEYLSPFMGIFFLILRLISLLLVLYTILWEACTSWPGGQVNGTHRPISTCNQFSRNWVLPHRSGLFNSYKTQK